MTRIREATLDDGLELVSMTTNFFRVSRYGALFPIAPDSIADLIVGLLENGVIFVAEETKLESIAGGDTWRKVGFLAAVSGAHPLSGQIFAEEVGWWVEPTARHTRLGYKLLGRFEEWARQKGAVVLKMVAPAESQIGDFYTRHGYTPLETAFVKRI